jgi:BirA family biotin operon repressor/biotin-[acetyl-CoA-carboxylase] ligase
MTIPRETRHFDTRHLGRTILIYDTVPSTNDLAASFSDEYAGTVFVAEHQSNGRGQYGRVWQASAGSSLLLSVLLFPPPELRRPVILTAWAAVAIAEAIRELAGGEARIKWPNDLLVGGKKVCGILIEQACGVVVGLGLNLNQQADDFAGLPDATSLGMLAGQAIDRDAALESVVRRLDAEYGQLLAGEYRPLEAEWKRRIGFLGRAVRIEVTDGAAHFGRLRDMAFDGIELDAADGGVRVLKPESIRGITAV